MKKLFLCLVVLYLTGCAVGNKYDYRMSSISMPMKPIEHQSLVLSVEDARPYVLDGTTVPNFVGLQRGGFGNPFHVTTVSGKSLTEDMSAAIEKSLLNAGFRVFNIQGNHEKGYLVDMAMKNGAGRIVALRVNEWKSDIFMGITLHCNMLLTVFDADGTTLAESAITFSEEIGGAQIGAAKNSQTLADEFSKRIGYLFNRPEIRSALQ